jgi:hypothetical protein
MRSLTANSSGRDIRPPQNADNDVQACAEVCRVAFDESAGRGFSYEPQSCDSFHARHYWPCLEGKVTIKDILGPIASGACLRPEPECTAKITVPRDNWSAHLSIPDASWIGPPKGRPVQSRSSRKSGAVGRRGANATPSIAAYIRQSESRGKPTLRKSDGSCALRIRADFVRETRESGCHVHPELCPQIVTLGTNVSRETLASVRAHFRTDESVRTNGPSVPLRCRRGRKSPTSPRGRSV